MTDQRNTHTVYVLHSVKYDKIYIGRTTNLPERFKSHNELGTKGWAIQFRPWQIVHAEEFESKAEAIKREKDLKTAAGRRWIRKVILGQ
ncbi:MAG: GIY-YIG nuclease family protein [Bacteroidetes bacterium]|jgi:putative endonuclease|nr:GIY-YIG nuclease family protein [Bacteroidota bacterium]